MPLPARPTRAAVARMPTPSPPRTRVGISTRSFRTKGVPMPISNDDLAAVKALISVDRAIPAIIVRSIVDRLDEIERALCASCRARQAPMAC